MPFRPERWEHPKPPFPKDFFERVREARPSFKKVDEFIIGLEERGKAWIVKKGQTTRIICIEGPQLLDVCIWNAHNPEEHFWDSYTLTRETPFLTTYSRLWSNLPWFRPMMTIIEDTVETKKTHPGDHHHYCFGSHCNPDFWYWALKDKNHPYVTKYNCWCNLQRAIKPFGLNWRHLHDNINFFTKTHWEDDGTHPVLPSDAKKGDYVELYAEMDVLIAASLCPSGTGTYHWSEAEKDTVHPVKVEIYDTGIEPLEFKMPGGPDGWRCCE